MWSSGCRWRLPSLRTIRGRFHRYRAAFERSHYKHVELIATQGRQVLMVLVMTGGEVSQQILTLAEPVRQEHLSNAADRLNQVCLGKTTEEIAALPPRSESLEKDILTLVLQDMNHSEARVSGEIYLDG